MLLLDASICRDFLRGAMPSVLDMLRANDASNIIVPAVIEAELRLGALRSARPDENLAKVELFLVPFERASFDSAAAKVYARLCTDLEQKGVHFDLSDALSAAVALACDATLVTVNPRAYRGIEGLRIESWAEVEF